MKAKIERIDGLLVAEYGEQIQPPPSEPLAELIFTILSQTTTRKNYERAYGQLRARFPAWEEVLSAPTGLVEEAIRSAGLSRVKAFRIQEVLRRILEERGELSLSFLHNLNWEEGFQYLVRLPGVGPKTAACVLLFSCGLPAFPVDTHVHRLSQRLGLAPKGKTAVEAQAILQREVPSEIAYRFHVNLVNHGRAICKAQRPRCQECVLLAQCRFLEKSSS